MEKQQKNIFITNKEQSDGKFYMDFANSLHTKAYLDSFGGEEYVAKKYPNFYKAYQKTVNVAKEKKLANLMQDGTIPNTFCVTAMNSEEEITNSKDSNLENIPNIMLSVYNYTKVHDVEEQFCFMTSEMYLYSNEKDKILLESAAYTSCDKDFEFKLTTNPLDYVGLNGSKIEEISTRHFVTKDGLLGAEESHLTSILVNGYKSIIKKITIEKPKSKNNNNPLVYLYNRSASSGEIADCSYEASQVQYNEKENTVNTLLGIKGTIEFNQEAGVAAICGFSDKSETTDRRLMVENRGAAEYNYKQEEMKTFFKPVATEEEPLTEFKVDFEFPDDWKHRLDKNVYDSGAKSVVVNLLFSFYYKITLEDGKGNTSNFDIPITIKSQSTLASNQKYYEVEKGTTVLIPPISIRWGCFAEDTKIKMADGSEKEIRFIQKGDMVLTPNGSKMVQGSYFGTEKTLIFIETEKGYNIRVTKDHPVLTERGILRAENLKKTDGIKMEDESYEKISQVYEIDYKEEQTVYNIDVDGGLVYADGFLVGEFNTQNDFTVIEENPLFSEYGVAPSSEEKEKDFSDEAKKVIRELHDLLEEQYGLSYTLPENMKE